MADVCCRFEVNDCSIEDNDEAHSLHQNPRASLDKLTAQLTKPMPVFIAFAAFLLLVFGHRFGLRSWVVLGEPFGAKRKSSGQRSGVRTATLEMVLDHDSGRMEGRCLKGRFSGRALSSLVERELFQLLDELRSTDAQGAVLVETISIGDVKAGAKV